MPIHNAIEIFVLTLRNIVMVSFDINAALPEFASELLNHQTRFVYFIKNARGAANVKPVSAGYCNPAVHLIPLFLSAIHA